MEILKQIQTAVSDQLPGTPAGREKNESIQTTLYSCADCGITFIASELDSCPRCQAALDEVPSGADLGFTAVDR